MKEKKISEETYRRHILRAKSRWNYFEFFRLYIKVMSKLEALFLQDLINHAASREEQWRLQETIGRRSKRRPLVFRGDDGRVYFMCSAKYLYRSMEWSDDEQTVHLKKLQEKGFIYLKRKGIPAMRYVSIDIWAIERAVDIALENKTGGTD